MKAISLPLCAAVLAFGAANAHAKDTAAHDARHNARHARAYYEQLLSGSKPQLAELNLLMTMLPKGGDLHHHYSGAIYAETYLDWLGRQGYCVYRQDDPTKGQQKYRIETKPAPEPDKNCLKADAIRKDNRFYREVLMKWSDKDYGNHSHQQVPPDEHFFDTFGYFGPISAYATKEGLRQLKERAKAENLQYLETMLRSAPATDHPELGARIDALPPDASDDAVRQALAPFADFLAHDETARKRIADYARGVADDIAGLDDADFTLRAQTYVSRNSAPSKVFSSLYAAFAAASGNPAIVGVNIVGPENGYVALRDYKLHMRMFRFLKQRFPSVRLALHAGELTLGMVPPEDLRGHIREAVEVAGAERIGHGIDLAHEDRPDQLIETLKRRNVAVEVNLTSNEFILGVKQEAHPVTIYLRHGVPFVISTDDAGVSRNNLSGEYLLFVSRYKPSYETLKRTVYNSIRYSFLPPGDKERQLRELDRRFVKFEAAAARMARAADAAAKASKVKQAASR
ncbi:MAG TPA: adenosine deaminase [Paucimonas sp.]|nr:adenosine deaminase [Paucimonas sp.]